MTQLADSPSSQSAVRSGRLPESRGPLPLLVEPGVARSAADLARWLVDHKETVAGWLREHGALLFRNFAIHGAADFEQVARAISPQLKKDYLGTSPRDALTEYVFSASELPPYYPIPQHCEMSFTRTPPRNLFFSCLIAPSGPGGETPLVDFRNVYRNLAPALRERFAKLGVRNIRNYIGPAGGSRFDFWKLKRWDEMFGTTDRAVVEQRCQEQGFTPTWLPGGRLRLINRSPGVIQHPETGDPVWFNHSQVFHLSAVPDEYRRVARRLGQLRYHLLANFARAAIAAKRHFTASDDQAMHCTFGDGSPISDAEMNQVRDAIWRNLVFFRWQVGDIVAIDNLAVAHGRMPYQGPRQVVVSWA